MKIPLELDDLAEFMRYVALDGKVTSHMERKPKQAPVEPTAAPEPAPDVTPADYAAVAQMLGEAMSAPQEKPEEVPWTEVSEEFRVEVRKTLAKLNKTLGGNKAKELVQKHGADKLTNVPLAELPALMKEAEEALKNA